MRIPGRKLQDSKLPRWYGVAWFDYMRDEAVLLPMPINLLVAFARWLCVRTMRFVRMPALQRHEAKIWVEAYGSGREDGLREAAARLRNIATRIDNKRGAK